MQKPLFLLLSILIISTDIFGHAFKSKKEFDSLSYALHIAKQDTARYDILIKIGKGYGYNNPDSAIYFYNKAKAVAVKIKDTLKTSNAIIFLGIGNQDLGNFEKAGIYFQQALDLIKGRKNEKSKKLRISIYKNMAENFSDENQYPIALKYNFKVLDMYNQLKKGKKYYAPIYNSIGSVYVQENNHKKTLEYYFKALKIYKEIGDKHGMATIYGNIGLANNIEGNADSALFYDLKALEMNREAGNKDAEAINIENIGFVYLMNKKYLKSLEYFPKALKMYKEIGDKAGIVPTLSGLGYAYLHIKKYKLAEKYLREGLSLSKKINTPNSTKYFESSFYVLDSSLSSISRKSGNWKAAATYLDSALFHYKNFAEIRHSLINKNTIKKQSFLEADFKFKKKLAARESAQEKKDLIAQAKRKRQETITFSISGILILVIIFAFFITQRLRLTRKQKNIIEKQKSIVDLRNKEISDSISYAKRIQEAILPSRFSLSESLKNGFVLFKPKDIVSGDFYWLETAPKSGAVYFAAADCTGHGVPGAMVSVVCANALSKALLEENITETGKLLDRTREIVIQQFSHSDENVKDGMDISLCKLTPSESGGGLLQWSGANNPLWIIRQNVIASPINREKQSQPSKEASTSKYELIEVKAHKQAIGKTENPKPFTTHNIELQKGDSIYIFSDGYADQFGGPNGKKFKYKQLKELLLSLQDKKMGQQKEAISQAFEDWKGNEEQVDDVCIIGVRV